MAGHKRHKKAAPRRGARERGTLARVLRGHDDAPVLPLHGALRHLVGEHVEVRGAAAVASGRVLRSGPERRQVDDGLRQPRPGHRPGDRRAAAARDAPDRVDQRHDQEDRGREGQGRGRGGAGLPRAQAPDRQALRGRRPAGQGQRHDPPSRPGHPAADGQGLLRFRRRDAEAVRAQAGRQDRRRRARRAQAPGRRRGPHGLAADRRPRSTRPTGSSPARAPARSSATSQANGVLARRMSVAGFANQEPIATNSTSEGRAKNRRVEVVLTRLYTDRES